MLKEKMLTISIFSLAISIIISASFISKEIRNNGQKLNSSLNMMSGGLNNIGNPQRYVNNVNNSIGDNSYNIDEAAEYIGITQERVYEIANSKDYKMPYIKIGDYYYFSKSALDKWLETARIEIKY